MARAGELRSFTTTITKPASGSDTRLQPASGVTITIKRQGATADETKVITTTATTLAVDNNGSLRPGETVQVGTDSGALLIIDSIDSRTQLTVRTPSGTVAITDGTSRLVPVLDVTVYRDPTGAETLASALTDANGFFIGYVYEQTIDFIVSGAGVSTTLFQDQRTGALGELFNVLDYGVVGDGVTNDEPALNRLLDAVNLLTPDAGISTIWFPRGIYLINEHLVLSGESLGSVVARNVRLLGDPGATIKLNSASWNTASARMLWMGRPTVTHENFEISGLIVDGSSYGGSGGETAIRGFESNLLIGLRIHGCTFQNIGNPAAGIAQPNSGIWLGGRNGGGSPLTTQRWEIAGCRFLTIEQNGVVGISTRDGWLHDCYFSGFENAAVDFEPEATDEFILNNTFEDLVIHNARTNGLVLTPGAAGLGALSANLANCHVRNVTVDVPAGTAARAVVLINMTRSSVKSVSVVGNGSTGANAVILASCQDSTIEDCRVNGFAGDGSIQIDSAFTVQGSGCSIHNSHVRNASGHSFKIISQADAVVTGCTALAPAVSGFSAFLVDNAGATPARNIISGCIGNGHSFGLRISTGGAVNDTVVAGCVFLSNTTNNILDNGTRTFIANNNKYHATDGMTGTITTTAAAFDTVSNGHILDANTRVFVVPTNTSAGTDVGLGNVFVNTITAGSFRLNHGVTAGMTFTYTIMPR